MKRKIYYIQWKDAWSRHGWHDACDADKTDAGYKCESVGFLIREDKKSIRLTQSLADTNETTACTLTVPTPWLTKKTFLGWSEEYKD